MIASGRGLSLGRGWRDVGELQGPFDATGRQCNRAADCNHR
jgi:hypothetical protein